MKVNFTEVQKNKIKEKLKDEVFITDVVITDHMFFKLSNGYTLKSEKISRNLQDYFRLQQGYEKEFVETVFNIFINL